MSDNMNTQGSHNNESPELLFIFRPPAGMLEHPPLASSLQGLETCLLLTALGRFPSALIACASAWESVIKPKLSIPREQDVNLQELLRKVRSVSAALRTYSQGGLDEFRRTRNEMAHYGFSPRDNEKCAALLLKIGLPFLDRCYRELFDFYLDWRDIRPDAPDFRSLTEEEAGKVAFLPGRVRPDMAKQYTVIKKVYQRANQLRGLNLSYCFLGLECSIRIALKRELLTRSEEGILEDAEVTGVKHDEDSRAKDAVEKSARYGLRWDFDCPICDGHSSLVCDLDDRALDRGVVSVRRCVCVGCGFVVPREARFLADELLGEALEKQKAAILNELGIK
jgi:hypothetical protein